MVIEKLQDVVERFAADQYDELEASAKELDALESAADDTKEAILDRLSLGGIFPMNRADLSRLVGVHGQHQQPGRRCRRPHRHAPLHAAARA